MFCKALFPPLTFSPAIPLLPPFLPPSEGFLLALHRIPTHAFSAPFLTTFIRVRESFEASNPLPFCWCIVIFVPFVRVFAVVAAAQRINVIVLSNYISSKRMQHHNKERETLSTRVLCVYYIRKRKQNKESGRLKALSRSRSSAFCSFFSRSLKVSSSLLTQKQQCVCRKDTPKEALQKCEKKDRRVPLSFFFELSLKFRVSMRP